MWSRSPQPQPDLLGRRRAFGIGLGADLERPEPAKSIGRFDLLKIERRAMGTSFELRFPAHTPGAVDLAEDVLDLIDDLEAQMTVYRDESEITRINQTAHLEPVVVEDRLFQLLSAAVAISRQTGGAYDITLGALSQAWGFTRGPKRVPSPDILAEARQNTGYSALIFDQAAKTIAFDRPGIMLNLGSIGKGYALDRAIEVIREYWWPTSALVHGGHSSVYALGSPPDQFGGRWQVALRNPFDVEQPLGTIHLRNRGMGTSGDLFQRFEHEGRLYGHILDPRTGEPAQSDLAGVTVLAPTAAEADALSTAFSLLKHDEIKTYIADRPEIGVIFVFQTNESETPRVETLNIGTSDYTPNDIEVNRPRKFRPLGD